MTGETLDISEYVDFDFYNLMWYHTVNCPSLSKEHPALGQWMVVEHRMISNMSYWTMPISGQPISETTVQHVTPYDILNPDIVAWIKAFDRALMECLDNTNCIIDDFNGLGAKYEGSDIPQWDT